ncbi:MAG: hypothetical protein LBD32_02075, partial [Cytophagales bacterium]|nr:hypothetical protein [Cytophagales bacterium]
WKKENSELGCNFVFTNFDHEIKNKLKNHFQGKQNYLGSIFGETILFDRINFFGECTYLKTFSFIFGSGITFFKNFSSSIAVRNYSPYLHNFYGKPFHENSEMMNEFGICNVNCYKIKNFHITLSGDYFFFPKPTHKVSTSQQGKEKILKIIYQFNKKDSLALQIKDKTQKDVKGKILSDFFTIQLSGQKSIGNFSFLSQMVGSINNLKKGKGLGLLETLKYKLQNFDANIFLGTTFTNGTKIYLREPTMKFCGMKSKMFNIPMLLFGGILGYKLKNNLSIEILYNFSYAYRDEKIGSGYDKVKKKFKNFIQMQMIYDF